MTQASQTPTLEIQIADDRRASHQRWLTELTQVPTAAGHEDRVVAWLTEWFDERPELELARDIHGNLTLSLRGVSQSERPLYFTAHMDHPAFIVEAVEEDHVVLSFRGGVMADYFPDAHLEAWPPGADTPIPGVLTRVLEEKVNNFPAYAAQFDAAVPAGSIVRWRFDAAEVIETDGHPCLHTDACDDLAALAAALAAMDELRLRMVEGEAVGDVRLLLTRAEEIGFIGAIGACKAGTIPRGARVLALENSRAFADSPIGGGPIVRVGDRISVFTPQVTADVARIAEAIGGPALPKASEKHDASKAWRWQRKLMAGGACEASVFCASGLAATCVCLPLGNYHNMADLAEVQAGAFTGTPRVGREYIALSDFHGLVDLLVGCGLALTDASTLDMAGATPTFLERLDGLWNDRASVLKR